jgi:hypothetical protein
MTSPQDPQDPFQPPPAGSPPPPAGSPPPLPAYGAPPPGYGPPPPGYGPPGYGAARGTNTLAIISLVGAFICTPAGLVCGIIALNQIKQTGEQGRGLAVAGVIISALSIVAIIAIVALGIAFGTSSCTTTVNGVTRSC